MGLLDGMLGGLIGGEMASAVNALIEKHGGIQGLVTQLEQQGLGPTVRSWVGNGPNQAVSAEQLHRALGPETLQGLAAKAGVDPGQIAQKLAQVLPQAIDHLTPGGISRSA